MAAASSMTQPVWVLADPRAGTAAQPLGVAERLDVPFDTIPLAWGPLARLPLPWPSLAGLAPAARALICPPWPGLVLAAGRRSTPVARWLRRRGARTVQFMRPGRAPGDADLLVIGRHDDPAPAANLLAITAACHRLSPARLAEARAGWAAAFAGLPAPRIALLVGGPVRGEGLAPDLAAQLGQQAAALAAAQGGSLLATTSRRSGAAASAALAAAIAAVPHRLHRWDSPGPNPYAGYLAWADIVVVTGDSVSMISEALATAAPVLIAETTEAPRHRRLWQSLYAQGQAQPFRPGVAPAMRAPLDEAGRVAAAIRARGWA
jgi:mitochondrial fission protein ELM1